MLSTQPSPHLVLVRDAPPICRLLAATASLGLFATHVKPDNPWTARCDIEVDIGIDFPPTKYTATGCQCRHQSVTQKSEQLQFGHPNSLLSMKLRDEILLLFFADLIAVTWWIMWLKLEGRGGDPKSWFGGEPANRFWPHL